LGSDVVVLEATETLLPMVDKDIVRQAEGQFRKQGLDVLLGTKVTAASSDGKQVTVRYTSAGGEEKSLLLDKLVVAVGRRPNTEGLNADGVGLKLDERGFVVVDEFCKTNLPNVYAIGDVVGGAMLAHKASEEGVAVAERLVGKSAHLNYQTIPSVIYTWPEIAWVGETEQALKASGREVKTGSFPFAASGRARAMEEFSGQVKMISDAKTDEILGVHMMGPNVSELVGEVVLAMEYKASSEDIACTIHAHPTLSEALHEAALAVDNRAIHV
jgi:dihydrolipoamide dehydrogenase